MPHRKTRKWRDLWSYRYDIRYGHYPHRYHMVTAHRLLTDCFSAVWAGLPTGYVASGASGGNPVEVQVLFSAPLYVQRCGLSPDRPHPLLGAKHLARVGRLAERLALSWCATDPIFLSKSTSPTDLPDHTLLPQVRPSEQPGRSRQCGSSHR